jgi:hypothetical protein
LNIKPREKKLRTKKRQIHNGVAGGLITLGVLLGVYVNPAWLWLPGNLGARCCKADSPASARSITFWTKPVRISNPTALKPKNGG